MTEIRKQLEDLIGELDEHRKAQGKVFIHKKSGVKYQLLDFAFDEKTNRLRAHYCRVALPRIKYSAPLSKFLKKFAEQH